MPSKYIRISGRVGHNNVLFSSAYRILLHKGSGELNIQKNGCAQLNHLGIGSHTLKKLSLTVARVVIGWK